MGTFGDAHCWQQDLNDALAEIYSQCPHEGAPPRTKEIFLVRHAKSQSNEAKETMTAGDQKKRVRLRSAMQLATVGFDSGLSSNGHAQLLEVRPAARAIGHGLQAVLFSPLQRAEQTALTLFGEEDGQGGFRPHEVAYWRALRGLKEKRFKEYVRSDSIMEERAVGLIRFMSLVPWERFAIVGHSQFFELILKIMGCSLFMSNANIWRFSVSAQEDTLRVDAQELVAKPLSGVPGSPSGDEFSDDEESPRTPRQPTRSGQSFSACLTCDDEFEQSEAAAAATAVAAAAAAR